MLIAINFHYVRPRFDAPFPGIHGVTPAQFESQLRQLGELGMFVSGEDIRSAIRGDKKLPENAFIVTFDDGLREQFDHALPVLKRLDIPALFFANTWPIELRRVSSVHKTHLLRAQIAPQDFSASLASIAESRGIEINAQADLDRGIEHYKYDEPEIARLKYLLNFVLQPDVRDAFIEDLFAEVFGSREAEISEELYMSHEQLKSLAELKSLGTHAHEHLPLGLLSDEAAQGQLTDSIRLIEKWTGMRPFALSYPYGSREASTMSVADAAASEGIDFAFTMERAGNKTLQAPLHLARFDNNDLPGGKAARWPADALFSAVNSRTWYLQ